MRGFFRRFFGAGRSREAAPGAAPLMEEARGRGHEAPESPASHPPALLASPPAWLIVGLGNPGARYAGTRHNAGFEVVGRLAGDARWASDPVGADVAAAVVAGQPVCLVLPTTFMNRSGDAVAPLLARHGLGADRLLVVVDDLSLPLGALRLRPRGGAGGHNGLASIEATLGFADYPRLRVGIGNSFAPGFQADYVLARFEPEERPAAEAAFGRAAEAVAAVVAGGVEAAMPTVNRRRERP